MAAIGCDFNWSTQHFVGKPLPEDSQHPNTFGDTCFGGGDGYLSMTHHTFNPRSVGVREGRRGRAEATVTFNALTKDGVDAVYSLHTIGFFVTNDWPPEDTNQAASVTMTSWEMLLNNHNPSDLTGACLSEGVFPTDWQIDVSLDP